LLKTTAGVADELDPDAGEPVAAGFGFWLVTRESESLHSAVLCVVEFG
jgi:hypothetical protein